MVTDASGNGTADGGLTVGGRITRVESRVGDLETWREDVTAWRSRLEGSWTVIKLIFGVSVLGTLLSAIGLWVTLTRAS